MAVDAPRSTTTKAPPPPLPRKSASRAPPVSPESRWWRPVPPAPRSGRHSSCASNFVQIGGCVHALDGAIRAVMHVPVIVVVILAKVALYGHAPHHRLLIVAFDLVHHRLVFRSLPEFQISADDGGAGALLSQFLVASHVGHRDVAIGAAPRAVPAPDARFLDNYFT